MGLFAQLQDLEIRRLCLCCRRGRSGLVILRRQHRFKLVRHEALADRIKVEPVDIALEFIKVLHSILRL